MEMEGIIEDKITANDDGKILYLWTPEKGISIDIRTAYEIAMQKRLRLFNLYSYTDLVKARELLVLKKNVLKETLTIEQEELLKPVIITPEDEDEAKRYKSFDEYVEVNK